ncbi:MAG: threonine/serine dehydratase [Candidatus Flexifilum sp.]|jgi:threonine dehydratase
MNLHLPVTLTDITAARARIRPYLDPTPLEAAPMPDERVWLKLENLNRTRSFKARGALNALLSLDDAARSRGVVTASSGNHAQGMALAASLLGVGARIVMPTYAARRKIAGVNRYGAEAVLHGATYDEAEAEARRIEREMGRTYISAYNDPCVIAGAGTIGLEIADALPAVRRVIVPVGGGGLISGIAVALKSLNPDIAIIGVNAAESPEMYRAFYSLDLPASPDTLADALAGDIEAGSITLTIVSALVDRIVLVSEQDIARAMRWLVYEAGYVGEGGGVVGLAALLSGAITPQTDDVVVVSGGNVDPDRLHPILCAG